MLIGLLRETQFCRYWSGDLKAAETLPIGDATVLARQDGKSIVSVCGGLTEDASFRFAELLFNESRRPDTRLIYVEFRSFAGELNGLAAAASVLESCHPGCALIAQLECAYGPALWFALRHFAIVCASPTARIGMLQCGQPGPGYDIELTTEMADELREVRPQIPLSTWIKLFDASVHGEQAEALGLVDVLRRDVWSLAGVERSRA